MDGVFGTESGGLCSTLSDNDIANEIEDAKLVVLDGNLCEGDLKKITTICRRMKKDVWFEPTSVTKSVRIAQAGVIGEVRYISPNLEELLMMKTVVDGNNVLNGNDDVAMKRAGKALLCTKGVDGRHILVTCGERGVSLLWQSNEELCQQDFPALTVRNVVSTAGAGDCFAGRCAGGIVSGETLECAIHEGIQLASLCCGCDSNVPERGHGRLAARL